MVDKTSRATSKRMKISDDESKTDALKDKDSGATDDDNVSFTGVKYKNRKGFTSGRWSKKEHELFVEGLELYGREWKRVASNVGTRSVMQTRTHAQKHFEKAKAPETSKDGKSSSRTKANSAGTDSNSPTFDDVFEDSDEEITHVDSESSDDHIILTRSKRKSKSMTKESVKKGDKSSKKSGSKQPANDKDGESIPSGLPGASHSPAGYMMPSSSPYNPSGGKYPGPGSRPPYYNPHYPHHHPGPGPGGSFLHHAPPPAYNYSFLHKPQQGQTPGNEDNSPNDKTAPSHSFSDNDILLPFSNDTLKRIGNREYLDLMKANCSIFNSLPCPEQMVFARNMCNFLHTVRNRRFFYLHHQQYGAVPHPVQDPVASIANEMRLDALKNASSQFHPYWLLGEHDPCNVHNGRPFMHYNVIENAWTGISLDETRQILQNEGAKNVILLPASVQVITNNADGNQKQQEQQDKTNQHPFYPPTGHDTRKGGGSETGYGRNQESPCSTDSLERE